MRWNVSAGARNGVDAVAWRDARKQAHRGAGVMQMLAGGRWGGGRIDAPVRRGARRARVRPDATGSAIPSCRGFVRAGSCGCAYRGQARPAWGRC